MNRIKIEIMIKIKNAGWEGAEERVATPKVKALEILSREEIDELRRLSPWMGIWGIVHAWGAIAGAMAMFVWLPNPATYLLAVAIIGARQLGLAILMHDGAHWLLFKSHKWNDRITQWFCAYPVKAHVASYRAYHLEHHRNTQQADDPDLVLSAPFPITKGSFWRKVARDLSGLTGIKLLMRSLARGMKRREASAKGDAKQLNFAATGTAGFLATNGALFGILWLVGHPCLYLTLWIVPFLTFNQLVTRIRSIAEHGIVPDDEDDFRNTRTTRAGWLARAFVAPYCVNYHIEHHLFTFVPWYNLPKAHGMLRRKGLEGRMEIGESYGAVLRRATGLAR